MAQRTTTRAVQDLLMTGGDYDNVRKPSLQVHVDSAAYIVDDLADYASGEGVTFPNGRQELVERWLACWFYTCNDPMYSQRTTLSASGAFLRGKDEYRERASAIDPTGALDALIDQNLGTMTWGGKAPTAQTPYEDRR